METRNLVATAQTTINVSTDIVWDEFVNPEVIKKYMFGSVVISDWEEGSPIIWKGEWNGKSYEDKGVILQFEPKKKLQYSHFSPLSGLVDIPENYHTVTVELEDNGGQTEVSLVQDKNPSKEDKEHSEKNWKMMLMGLKNLLEENTK